MKLVLVRASREQEKEDNVSKAGGSKKDKKYNAERGKRTGIFFPKTKELLVDFMIWVSKIIIKSISLILIITILTEYDLHKVEKV